METSLTPEALHVIAQTEDSYNQLTQVTLEMQHNAREAAHQLGYEGTLSVGALEDEIRFYQKQTAEACLELGKRLLLLKELTAHGEFQKRVELLGISPRTARRFMSATLKFSKRPSMTVLEAAGNQTKLLELLVLDDGDISALEQGEAVSGLHLDAIETMSASELRKALRKAKTDADQQQEINERIIKEKNAHADELARRLHMPAEERWEKSIFDYQREAINLRTSAEHQLHKLRQFIDSRGPDGDMQASMRSTFATTTVDCVNRLTNMVAELQNMTHLYYQEFIDQPIYTFGEPLDLKQVPGAEEMGDL